MSGISPKSPSTFKNQKKDNRVAITIAITAAVSKAFPGLRVQNQL